MSTMMCASSVMTGTELSARLFTAWYLLQARTGGAKTQDWLAEEVSKELGLEPQEYLTQSLMSRYLRGSTTPPVGTIAAIAKVLGVDPGWLAFGPASQAPAPNDPMLNGMRRLLQPEG